MARLGWIPVFLLWAALDLSSAPLLVPVEALEEPQEAVYRAAARRRFQPERRPVSALDQSALRPTVRLSSLVAAAMPRHAREVGVVRKLPPSGSPPDPAPDDH